MDLRSLGLALLIACESAAPTARDAAVDASTEARDAAPPDEVDASDAELEAGVQCADPRFELDPLYVPRSGMHWRVELSDLCAALAEDGRMTCPRSRRDLLEGFLPVCRALRTFPVLQRRCDVDIVEDTRFVRPDESSMRAQWKFDGASGELIAANVFAGGFKCGSAFYRAGPEQDNCTELDRTCSLCGAGAARDQDCPQDVVEALPGKACGAPDATLSCGCDVQGANFTFPKQAAVCNPDACDNCQGGTCWADCKCAFDGAYRWVVQCTE